MNKLRLAAGRWVPIIGLLMTVVSYVLLTYLAYELLTLELDTATPAPDATSEDILFGTYLPYLFYEIARGMLFIGIGATYLFLPGFVSAVIALPVAVAWRQPVRILVLRRFSADEKSRTLKRLVREHIAPVGHVYTLADRDIKTPWYIRFPVLFTQLVFLHFRQRRITSERAIDRLTAAMDVRWARNVNWLASSSKTFALQCTDALWRTLVKTLTAKVDAVVIDVHEESPNLAWEIRQCIEDGHIEKTVFVTSKERRADAIRFLDRLGLEQAALEKLIVYDGEAGARLGAVLEAGMPSRPTAVRAGLRCQLTAASIMVGPFLWAALLVFALLALMPNDDDDAIPNRFQALAASLEDAATRDAAFVELLDAVAEAPADGRRRTWIADFDEAIIPVLGLLWAEEPARRAAILTSLADVSSPGAAPVYRAALRDLAAGGEPGLDEILRGITASQAIDNTADLLELLPSVTVAEQVRIIQTFGELGAKAAVPALVGDFILGDTDAGADARRTEAVDAVEQILLDRPPLVPLGRFGQPAALIAVFGSPGMEPFLLRFGPLLASESRPFTTNMQTATPPTYRLYAEVEVVNLLISYPADTGLRVLQEVPFEHRAKGLFEFAERTDGAVLEVSADRGVDDLTRQQIAWLEAAAIPRIAVLIDTQGASVEPARLASLTEELRRLLSEHGYPSDATIVAAAMPNVGTTIGSAARAGVEELLAEIDSWPGRPPAAEQPTRFSIGAVFAIPARGALVTGSLERGTLTAGDSLETMTPDGPVSIVVRERFDALQSDLITAFWFDGAGDGLAGGQVLTPPGESPTVHSEFSAWIYILNEAEGGPRNFMVSDDRGELPAFTPGARIELQLRNAMLSPSDLGLRIPTGSTGPLRPSDLLPRRGWALMDAELATAIPIVPGERLRLFSDGRLVAAGAVTEVE